VLYFDQTSGEAADAETIAVLGEALARFPANPEGLHGESLRSRHALDDAGNALLNLSGLPRHRVIFSTSATAIFWLFSRYLRQKKNSRLASSLLSHPALEMAMKETGKITPLPLTAEGVSLPSFSSDAPDWLILPQIDSELGLRGMTGEMTESIRQNAPQILTFCDAVQAFGKEPLIKADAVIVSGHKIGAPGAAALFYNPERIKGFGEFAEKQRREAHFSERPETAFVLAMTDSARRHQEKMSQNRAKVTEYNSFLRNELQKITAKDGKPAVFPVALKNSSPYILSVLFPGRQSAILLRMLSKQGISVGSGAACAAESGNPSRILAALKYDGEEERGALRISLSPLHTEADCRVLVDALRTAVANY